VNQPDPGRSLLNLTANSLKNLALRGTKSLAKHLIKKIISTKLVMGIVAVLKFTAIVWVPILLILGAYMIIYAIPRQMVEANADEGVIVASFLGVEEDDPFLEAREGLFDLYHETADRWSEDLSEDQIQQASVHKFPWSILVATDRIINDETVWQGKPNINPQPEKVFDALRPVFEWKESTVTIVTVSCSADDEGAVTCTTDVEVIDVLLLEQADTLEGTFKYIYEWQTETSEGDSLGSSTTTTKEVLIEVIPPEEYYKPWKDYLLANGLLYEEEIELAMELAMLYDEEYRFNHALLMSYDYSNYPFISGSNGWLWPTPSTRITSTYGPRSYPRNGFHYGVDVGATSRGVDGDPVWSIDDGTVIFSGTSGGYGNLVIIEHADNITTYYAHLRRRHVSAGETVVKGEPIGVMGSTGFSTATHLHFEIRLNNNPLNPLFYFTL
jgi:murein DD-endopeptidase MepM/ murein hydrolase activator NlpD